MLGGGVNFLEILINQKIYLNIYPSEMEECKTQKEKKEVLWRRRTKGETSIMIPLQTNKRRNCKSKMGGWDNWMQAF